MHTTAFGKRLRAAMICAGLSAPQLAQRIGVSRQTVYRWLALIDPPAMIAKTLIQPDSWSFIILLDINLSFS